ncbi:MAG: TfoX/Sxy family protein [Aequorivita sp.]
MAFNIQLADRIREYLFKNCDLNIVEKKMFGGLAFMIDGKMCINVSGENLMCRFHPSLENEVAEKTGFEPMIMKGKQMQGYCYVNPEGFKYNKNFEYWLNICLAFNPKAKASKK